MESLVLTAPEARQSDAHTIQSGTSAAVLMERVAGCVVSHILNRTDLFPQGPILVLCGSGNNGGDGFAVARLLHDGSCGVQRDVCACFVGLTAEDGSPDPTRMSADCADQYHRAADAGVQIATLQSIGDDWRTASVLVDAVFGIGLCRPIDGPLARLFADINATAIPVLAIDIPSGIHADTGHALGVALSATLTVTVQALKRGLLFNEGAEAAGKLSVCDIGIDLSVLDTHTPHVTDWSLVSRVLPPRSRQSHKGTYGRLLLACGSVGMAGAAVMASEAALRCGSGLVDVLTPEANRTVLQTRLPEAIVSPYTDEPDYDSQLARAIASCDAVVAGCGMGTSERSYHAISQLFNSLPDAFPLVLDADALNLLAIHPELWETSALKMSGDSVVITPHPSEMARLRRSSVLDVLDNPVDVARQFAAERSVTVVLKGAYTVIASPSGQAYINLYGNAGMATGGSGDVLAGVIGALTVQNRARIQDGRLSLCDIAAAGVTLHAMAADLAVQTVGEYGLCATDIIRTLPLVTKELSDSRTRIGYVPARCE